MQPGEEELNDNNAIGCRFEISPCSTKYWIPECESTITPILGQIFGTIQEGITFYKYYAGVAGFDVRKSTVRKNREGDTTLQYLVCSREGYKNVEKRPTTLVDDEKNSPPVEKKRRITNRVGCNARMVMKTSLKGGFIVSILDERHNHYLCSETSKQFLKVNRKLDIGHQTFIANCVKANIGPIKSYRLYKEMVGNYSAVGATSVDFHNFKRDLQAYLNGHDAQLLIDKFFKKKEVCPAFYFDYDIDEQQHLNRLFWADQTARRSYAYFGDVVSFDATYSTNRYKLVFVPFTGVDNHKRCITFAAGLLTKENKESYEWLLQNFNKAMGHAPNYIITDQDPALKATVGKVFPATRHRFCMWHIMTKTAEKAGPVLAKDDVFRRKLNAIVWNEMISIDEFELKWNGIMEDYGLVESTWFQHIFELRSFWIPAYFRDMDMGGLIRTTSRSEGENSMFGRFFNKHSTLVEFLMHFESALDAQRYEEAKLNAACEGHFAKFKTPLLLERHAASEYTVSIFHEVQTEIEKSCFSCSVISIAKNGQIDSYEIKGDGDTVFCVTHNPNEETINCTCRMFTRVGLLCRHIFLILKYCRIDRIPPQYIVPRWTRKACVRSISGLDNIAGEQNPIEDNSQSIRNQLWTEIHSCVGLVSGDNKQMQALTRLLREHKQGLMLDHGPPERSRRNTEIIEELCGTITQPEVCILPPVVAKNKGSGKRIKGKREIAIEAGAKRARRCRKCDKYVHDDSRNCTNVP